MSVSKTRSSPTNGSAQAAGRATALLLLALLVAVTLVTPAQSSQAP
jgi:hypothetical protein